ncbi:hypothetical protein E2562_003143 [Oryza meyeriana var. granulata]|uniref:Uncharacterized protein n=1 Tax=Oryza meyeriana var. granulata TaxID=110450 RepID=A0A6G1E994_9ORYZ|nr:hypothetical protein E2562_003143 [Oryza meyeriana var. granulata]
MEGPAAKGRMFQSHHENGTTETAKKPFPRPAKKRARRTTARGNKCPTAQKQTPAGPPGRGPIPPAVGPHGPGHGRTLARENSPPNHYTGPWAHRASGPWPQATQDDKDGPPNSPTGPQGSPGRPAETAARRPVSVDGRADRSPHEKGA